MVDITKKVSHLIESQFPEYYRESGAELVAFIKAYYEFLEKTDKYSIKMSKQMFELNDIDDSLSSFVSHFQHKFLADFPSIITTDKKFAIKHILDLYSSKGSQNSLELLMKLLYNQESDVYYPGQDVLKPSDSVWVKPQYIEVSKSVRTVTFLGQQITGSGTGAKGFVESIVRKRVDGKFVDIIYLSNTEGQFSRGEKVTNDGLLSGAPTIIGSLTTVDLTLGGRGNKVGDIFDVVTPQAKHGKVRVTEIQNFTGKVDFKLIDGGYGYTSAVMAGTNDFVANSTQVLVSTAILNVENSANSFIIYEPVLQRIEKIYLYNATNINGNTNVIGSYLIGKNADDTQVANGMIIAVANTNSIGDVISTPSANSLVTLQLVGDTTFGFQKKMTMTSSVAFATGEYIDEESTYTLDVSANTGVFSVGNAVKQTIVTNGHITSVATGTVLTANSTKIVLKPAWGPFVTGTNLVKTSAPTVNCSVDNVTTTVLGARGLVTGRDGANVDTRIVYGSFTDGNTVYGNKTKLFGTILSSTTTSASDVYLNGVNSANAVIGAPAGKSNVYRFYANGIIVGQNSSAIGIYGNTFPFYYSSAGTYYVETNREQLISPPRYANNMIIELNAPILGIKGGKGANFKVGYLENTENIQLNTDIIGSNNAVGVPFKDILVSGQGSGVGFVNDITIVSGGTNYANGDLIAFGGGGRAGGAPWLHANAYITTNGSGTITDVTVVSPGEGYFSPPTMFLPSTSGTVAVLTPVMTYGYGFVKNPSGAYDNYIEDLLTNENFLIGSIGTLTKINPGSNYNADPFVRVYNQYIASYGRGDFIINVDDISGSFKVGERLEQDIGPSETAKGTVISYSAATKTLRVHRTSFNVGFAANIRLVGSESNASANIVSVTTDSGIRVVGDNAIVSANVIVANGVATKVEVIDSGFGYIQDGSVTLESSKSPYVMTATTNVKYQGVGSGYWKTTTSHLNSEKKIHDNKYYQEYSYDIISGLSLDRYKNIVKKILHVSGNELFGSVERRSTIGLTISVANSSITVV